MTEEELLKLVGMDGSQGEVQPSAPAKPSRSEPLTDWERFIVNNVFDTQPAKRKAYLKQRGLELDPKDDNRIRPIGSTGGYAEIDPGFNAYFKKGGLKEIGKDITDIIGDLIEAPITAVAATKGGAIGSALGPVGAVGGAVVGGGAGKLTSETIKNTIGDVLLEESVPSDKKLMAIQAVFSGIATPALKGLAKAGGAGVAAVVKARKDAIINMAKGAGGQLDDDLVKAIARNPENFTKEKVDGASRKMLDLYRELFGDNATAVKDTKQISPDTLFGQALKPLRDRQQAELKKLASNPKADVDVSEITQPMIAKIKDLASKFDRSAEEDAALSYLKGKVDLINKKASTGSNPLMPGSSGVTRKLNFGEAREILDVIQDDSFNREIAGSSILKQVAGGNAKQNAIRAFLDKRASEAGSELPQINAEMSKKLSAFELARDQITPSNLTKAFVGKSDVPKALIKDTFDILDKELGTDLGKRVQDGTFDMVVDNIYKNPTQFGSGPVLSSVIKGGVEGAVKGGAAGAAAGFPFGVAPITGSIGALVGGVDGARLAASTATPQRAIDAISKITRQEEALANYLSRPSTQGDELVRQAVSSVVSPADEMTRESSFREEAAKGPTEEELLRSVGY